MKANRVYFGLIIFLGAQNMSNGTESNTKKFQKPTEAELAKALSPEQFQVTQKEGTERPFANQYWDHKEDGIYVDVV